MRIPCLGMDSILCPECKGLGRKEIKIYPRDTPAIDMIGDHEGECEKCEGRGWIVTHEWLDAELIGV